MFRAEAMFRKECTAERDEAVDKAKNAQRQHNMLIKKIDDLENELGRKTRLSV